MIKRKVKNKKGRVIIRNLSFKATEEVLRNKFSKFGEISEIIIPKKPDGKMCGFGFVQFEKTASAIKAINALNAKEILGRPVAIDFAIPKDRFKELKTQTPHPEQKKDASNEDDGSAEEEDPHDEKRQTKQSKSSNDSDDDDETSNIKQKQSRQNRNSDTDDDNDKEKNSPGKKQRQSKSSHNGDTDDDTDEVLSDKKKKYSKSNSDSDTDDDNNVEATRDKKRKISRSSSESNTDDDDDDDSPDKKRKHSRQNTSSDGEVSSNRKTKLSRPSDVNEGRTLFIRNLSFDTTAEELKETMSKYGDIKYCLLCKDPLTEYPKGTAFVQFANKEDAEKCLDESNAKDTKIILGDRLLNVVLAVTHEDIKKQREARIKKGKDNRNLKLETEGLIRPGSEAAEGVSQSDLTKRLQLEKYKRKLLKNLNYFISPVRLCIHNIPLHLDDKKLRKIFLKAAGSGAVITETRIMRNFKKLDEKGVGLSKGFAFVCFTKHEHALQALQNLNNNPVTFSPHKRPIVEFSVENRSILNAKRRQMERQNKRPFQPKRAGNHQNINNLKIQEKKEVLSNKRKKFSKSYKSSKTGNKLKLNKTGSQQPFKPNKTGNQQLNKKKLSQKQKKKFHSDIKKKKKIQG